MNGVEGEWKLGVSYLKIWSHASYSYIYVKSDQSALWQNFEHQCYIFLTDFWTSILYISQQDIIDQIYVCQILTEWSRNDNYEKSNSVDIDMN